MKYVFPEYKENVVLGDGKLQLNPMSYQVIYEGKEIDLTPREFEVLYLLAQRPNWVIRWNNSCRKISGWKKDSGLSAWIRLHTGQ